MKKEEIKKYVAARNNTVLNFPDRGPWGNNRYRGNCSGWVIAYLIWRYGVKSLAELFAGGGTGSDVCRDMDIPYIGADLNPNPVRNNILTTDAVSDEVPDEFRDKDMLFMHPPYGAEIAIPYALIGQCITLPDNREILLYPLKPADSSKCASVVYAQIDNEEPRENRYCKTFCLDGDLAKDHDVFVKIHEWADRIIKGGVAA